MGMLCTTNGAHLTTSSTANLPPTVCDRLGRHFGGQPADGRQALKVEAAQDLALVQQGATLLDVRESSEGKSGHAPGAVHVALARINQAPRRLRQARPVVVKCASGSRSRVAAKHWQRAGGEVRR